MTALPSLQELGTDLLVTTPRQRRLALARPFAGVLCFAAVAWLGWWWLTPLVVFGIFVAVVTVTHDVVHRTLGLSERQTDRWLFWLGLVLLESGHAYRITHRQHHRIFPSVDDPEGYPADLSLLGAVLYGPVFLFRLWAWSFARARLRDRLWLLAEAAAPVSAVVGGLYFRPLLVYAVLAIAGSWVYPLLTVYLPHHGYGDEPLRQTRTLRGKIIPAVFLELTYHLEHHLYPQVPSHNLPELARRLDPVLARAGVRPVAVP
ncbi:fatty acid desaturase [Hamadaea tsunoensis]|uniref:fatty acid desaturase n=1 Tax=Hamadaea tsunoensis TaxID=53368 RepID=UPI0004072246|nr:fatty acid desaturase [Hamadaea tsunoensis]